VIASFCKGQTEIDSKPTDQTNNLFWNYLLQKDKEELSLNCQRDTIFNSRDSVIIHYLRPNKRIFKTLKFSFHTGYVIKVHDFNDSFNFSNLIKDTTVLTSIETNYYDSLTNFCFGKVINYVRSSSWDSPCYGCYTIYVTDKPDEIYHRAQYYESDAPSVEIYFNNLGDDWGYKRARYFYNSRGKFLIKKVETISINQFWEN
jgi:hypothetical protein